MAQPPGEKMNRTTLGAAIALMIAAPVLGAQQQYGRDSDVWRWDGRVDAGKWMNVFNVNGSVEFTPRPDNMVHLVAAKRPRAGRDPAAPPSALVPKAGNITLA